MNNVHFMLVLGGFTLVVGAFLARQGFRNGDREGDAFASVGLAHTVQPDGLLALGSIRVHNDGQRPVIVSAVVQPVRSAVHRLGWGLREPVTVREAHRSPLESAPAHALLGVVDAQSEQRWDVPVPQVDAQATITVRLDQVGGRSRVFVWRLDRRGRPPGSGFTWSDGPFGEGDARS